MRKLTLYCEHGLKHYSAAAAALTQVGMTKGFKKGDKMVAGEVGEGGRGIFGDGAFNAAFDANGYVVIETWVETCHMFYAFSWPDLRMLKMQLDRCACGKPSTRGKG